MKATAIFGLFDGLTSVLGMVLALVVTGNMKGLVVAVVAATVSASLGMGAGEWLSDSEESYKRAEVMSIATFLGTLLPGIPFFFGRSIGSYLACCVLTTGLGVLIAELRPGARIPSYLKTFLVLVVVTGISLGASLIAGGIV